MFLKSVAISAFVVSALTIAAQQAPPVLMISVDGMRPDYVTHAADHGLKLPTLRGLMRNGAYAEGVTGVFPTVTYPSHTTLVTGVWPAEHGVLNNKRFDPDNVTDGSWYWYADQIKVSTLWSIAHAAGLRTASVGWPVTVNSNDIDILLPEYWRGTLGETKNSDDRYLLNAIARPLNEVSKIGDRIHVPYLEDNETTIAGDEIKTKYSLEILKTEKPRFMTIHLSSLDEEEHLHGPFSIEANADLESIDAMLARLIAQERANDPNSVVVVVSDHGFADIDHALDLGVAFVKAGLMPATPKPGAPWLAQPWALGSMFAIMLHSPSDEAVKQRVYAMLQTLAADPANGIEAVLDPAQIASAGGPPNAAYVVTLRKGFAATATTTGDLVIPVPDHRGTHGFDPRTTPEMRASFFATGAGIAKDKNLGIVDMRQVAPTVAQLLGLRMETAKQPPLPIAAR